MYDMKTHSCTMPESETKSDKRRRGTHSYKVTFTLDFAISWHLRG